MVFHSWLSKVSIRARHRKDRGHKKSSARQIVDRSNSRCAIPRTSPVQRIQSLTRLRNLSYIDVAFTPIAQELPVKVDCLIALLQCLRCACQLIMREDVTRVEYR